MSTIQFAAYFGCYTSLTDDIYGCLLTETTKAKGRAALGFEHALQGWPALYSITGETYAYVLYTKLLGLDGNPQLDVNQAMFEAQAAVRTIVVGGVGIPEWAWSPWQSGALDCGRMSPSDVIIKLPK